MMGRSAGFLDNPYLRADLLQYSLRDENSRLGSAAPSRNMRTISRSPSSMAADRGLVVRIKDNKKVLWMLIISSLNGY